MNFPRKISHAFPAINLIRLVVVLLTMSEIAGCNKDEVTNIVIGGGDPTDPAIQPVVKSTYPSGGSFGPFNVYNRSDGSYKPHFVLVFNKLMSKYSFTSKSIIVKGFDRPVVVVVEGYYILPRLNSVSSESDVYDDVFSFTIRDSINYYPPMVYRVGQTYTVIVDSTVEDINGRHLSNQFTFMFTPEPYFRVISFYPLDGTTDVSLGTNPAVFFNSPVDNTVFQSLQLTPLPAGKWKLYDYDSLQVYYVVTAGTLPFNTNYTLIVPSFIHDAQNRLLTRQYSSRFGTVPFKVYQAYPHPGENRVSLNPYIALYMTGTIDSGTVRSAFSIVPPVAGNLQLYFGSASFAYSVAGALRPNSTYTVTVGSSLAASDGTSLLPYSFSFTTDQFNVSSTYPGDAYNNVDRNTRIDISFNGRIDTGSVRSAFSISPPVAGTFGLTDQDLYFSYYQTGLASKTTYTVTISTAMRTRAGDHLSSPYSFSFTSAP